MWKSEPEPTYDHASRSVNIINCLLNQFQLNLSHGINIHGETFRGDQNVPYIEIFFFIKQMYTARYTVFDRFRALSWLNQQIIATLKYVN